MSGREKVDSSFEHVGDIEKIVCCESLWVGSAYRVMFVRGTFDALVLVTALDSSENHSVHVSRIIY